MSLSYDQARAEILARRAAKRRPPENRRESILARRKALEQEAKAAKAAIRLAEQRQRAEAQVSRANTESDRLVAYYEPRIEAARKLKAAVCGLTLSDADLMAIEE